MDQEAIQETPRQKIARKLKAVASYMVENLQQPSTWRGIVMLIGGSGAFADPERADAWIGVAVLVSGAVGAIMKD